MNQVKKPIWRSVLIGGIIFALVLSIALSVQSYILFSRALYDRYDQSLERILIHVEHNIDVDDLEQCVKTVKHSKKYDETQQFLNAAVDEFELTYLYAIIPEKELMYNAISATSAAERAAGDDDMPLMETSDAYTPEMLAKYRSYWDTDGVSYFEESSEWGDYYTAVLPLKNSKKQTVALLCADVPIQLLHKLVRNHMIDSVILIVLISGLFVFLMLLWLRRNITQPLHRLEQSTRGFADKSHGNMDFRDVEFEDPQITSENEVHSLAVAVHQMSDDMKDHITQILSAQEQAASAREKATTMTAIAYRDALTGVKSKAAFDEKEKDLRDKAEFGIVMLDLNDLKTINDVFGHDHGDQYLIGSCRQICEVFKHSPVYRVGGDEFIVVLEGSDYVDRDVLMQDLEAVFERSRTAYDRPEWERYSAAFGMAVYNSEDTDGPEAVIKLADTNMYQYKKSVKES